VGTSGLFCIEIPEGAHWVPTDKNRRVPAGNPLRVPDGIPDGSLKGTDWCVWLGHDGIGRACIASRGKSRDFRPVVYLAFGSMTGGTSSVVNNFDRGVNL